ncbi:MAG: murein hydrolase activator NlpD [Sodalis sp. Fse]|nr:MAG: murein hydrolase activator NlpD [Sodalis sp. Fse]
MQKYAEELKKPSRKGLFYHVSGGRYCVAAFAMVSIWLTGCASNKFSAPISHIGGTSSAIGGNTTCASQMIHPCSRASNGEPMIISQEGSIIYSRHYDSIHKGSYYSSIYKVKRGDTLFYIAWITGKDYRNLGIKNNIKEPYRLTVGQILHVGNGANSIIGSAQSNISLAADSNNAGMGMIANYVPSTNTQLTELIVDSNKNNCYLKSSSKQNRGKLLSSSNDKMMSNIDTTVSTIARVNTFGTALSSAASNSMLVTKWFWPTEGKIVDNFTVTEGGNKGIDISGSLGQPILATTSGRVVYAGNALRGYGNLIIIKHNDDYLSAYAHNDTILVREQQKVRAGQKIATMGISGTSSVKLHFEIRYKGKSVNPLSYLQQR